MTKHEKVFCQDCKYFLSWVFAYVGRVRDKDECSYPDNVGDTWASPKSMTIESPSVINADNSCGWFERKRQEKPKKRSGWFARMLGR